jgi:hypothetical protein
MMNWVQWIARVCVASVALLAVCGCGGSTTSTTTNPPPSSLTLTIIAPEGITLSGINWVVAGVPSFTLLATGTGFTSATTLRWNGAAIPTQFGSRTGLSATVAATLVASPGTASIAAYDSASSATSSALPFGIASPAAASAGVVQMITVAPDGTPGNANSLVTPSISSTGRYVSFQSAATNLSAGVSSTYQQIYERDTCIGAPTGCVPATIPISVTYDGSPVDGNSRVSSVSGDGRYVAFDSQASNIVSFSQSVSLCSATAGDNCVYVRDTCIGAVAGCRPTTTLVSTLVNGSPAGGGNPTISSDGRFIVFNSTGTSPGTNNIYKRDTCTGVAIGCTPTTVLISESSAGVQGNENSILGTINTGARYVAFISYANNLIANDTNPGNPDLYLRDTCLGVSTGCVPSTTEEDVSTSGTQAVGALDTFSSASINSDGRFLSFSTLATNLVSQNVNGFGNVYLRDTCNGVAAGCTPTTSLASLGNDGSIANASQDNTSISATGRFIAFASLASNLVPGDTFPLNGWKDIFVRDTCFGASPTCAPSTVRVSVSNSPYFAQQSNAINDYPQISADGHYIVFLSASTNYLPSGGSGFDMVYLAKTGF